MSLRVAAASEGAPPEEILTARTRAALRSKVGFSHELFASNKRNVAANGENRPALSTMQSPDASIPVGIIRAVIEIERTGIARRICVFVGLPQKPAHRGPSGAELATVRRGLRCFAVTARSAV